MLFSQENRRSFVLGLELAYFSPNAMLLCGRTLLVLKFPQVFFSSNSGAQGFRSWGSLFWIMPPDCLVSFPNLVSYQVHHQNFLVCLLEAFNLFCQDFRRIDFFEPEFWDNLGPFLPESQLHLEVSYFSTSCWVSLHHQHVDGRNYCHRCTCFQTCNYDTREDADNDTTIFYIFFP